MVHLPRRFAQATINQLFRILRPGGVLYISAQSGGDAVLRRDGRFFVYYTEAELEAKFQKARFKVHKRWKGQTHKGTCGDRRPRVLAQLLSNASPEMITFSLNALTRRSNT